MQAIPPCGSRRRVAVEVAAIAGKPSKGFMIGVAFRRQSEHAAAMNLAALKRKTMKTPPRWALEASAR
jgi:hypothetical protein